MNSQEENRIDFTGIQVIGNFLAPEYVIPTAEHYGNGNPVLGAPLAYKEVRTHIRKYMSMSRQKKGFNIETGLILRALGWIPWGFQQVTELTEDNDIKQARVAKAMWPSGPATIPGAFQVNTFGEDPINVFRATMIACSELLRDNPKVNRAYVYDKVYQRHDSRIMIHLKAGTLKSLVLSPAGKDIGWVQKKVFSGLRKALRAETNELKVAGEQMFEAWLGFGFITSPAGIMVSFAPKVPLGYAALVPYNGVSLAACVNKVKDGKCWITLTPDHRVYDGDTCGAMYEYLESRIEEILQNECP